MYLKINIVPHSDGNDSIIATCVIGGKTYVSADSPKTGTITEEQARFIMARLYEAIAQKVTEIEMEIIAGV